MANKKDKVSPKPPSSSEEKERKLLENHPYETMSQIQNRYGKGREKSGSDGSKQDARGTNH